MKDTKFRKTMKLIRDGEFASLLKMAVKSIMPRKLFYFDKLYIVGADSIIWKPRRSGKISIRQATVQDVKLISSVYGSEKIFSNRFRNNCDCFIAEINGAVAGAIWLRYDTKYKTNSEYLFNNARGNAWVFDVFVVPAYRLRGVFQNLMEVVLNYVKSRSYAGVCGEIHYENKISMNSHLRLGFHILEEISYISITGLFTYLVTSHENKKTRLHLKFVNPLKIGNNLI